jgi:hypothetical protein
MPDSCREPLAPSSLFSQSPAVSRRTLIGAAWSAPVVLASVAAPLAAASGGGGLPDATILWAEEIAYFGTTSELLLVLPADSEGIGSTGTIIFTSENGGSIPRQVSISGQTGWVYTRDTTDNVGIMTSPASGVIGGPALFSVEWSSTSEPGTILATWENSLEQGSIGDTIVLDSAPRPTLTWLTNPVTFGAPTTLQLVVPADAAGTGQPSYIISGEYLPDAPSPAFPSGTQIAVPVGWVATVLTETDPFTGVTTTVPALQAEALTPGTYEFIYTIGSGTTPVSPKAVLAIFNTSGLVDATLNIVAA